ncbi:low molecular weight phosphotyrosine protein phosphatase [Marinilongibacter aquaticus]|uniref:low molecular weight protein-tyrosine-phosphatase n=1 Tax=Marinilongibacter aquaticus TaxID=2975157 RepID=UPI0021BD57B6|nr:low molecular weight protein-tyrosine-phosphatase [Marinilongibacter aquaticus]UBM59811.1 low molecular weight phosphotyrosine protein phosphatase [Marinilongibacter aquaticus]
MVSVLFVDLGNICRSPMAEAIFKRVVRNRGLSEHFKIDSAGTAGYHVGQHADRRVMELLEKKNLRVDHLGRKLAVEDMDAFTHIAVMDEENFKFVHNMYHKYKHQPPTAGKLFLIRDFDPETRGVQIVPDPFYESKEFFEDIYTILWRSCEGLLDHIIEQHELREKEEEEESEGS